MFLGFPNGPEGAGWSVEGEHFLESEGGPAAECVAGAQQEHEVTLSLVDGPAAAALDGSSWLMVKQVPCLES